MKLQKSVADGAVIARMTGFDPTGDYVTEDLVARYPGNDARVLAWLCDIAAATRRLFALERAFQAGALDTNGLACHALLHRDLAALRPALAETLGDLDGCVFVAMVDTAGASWQRFFERVGVAGRA